MYGKFRIWAFWFFESGFILLFYNFVVFVMSADLDSEIINKNTKDQKKYESIVAREDVCLCPSPERVCD